jgi:hypothetical protein
VDPKDAPAEVRWKKVQCKNVQPGPKGVPCGRSDVMQVSLGQLQGELSDQVDDILQVHGPGEDA